ncbi:MULTISPECIES: shikimate kinase [Holdemanella]|jgi:shikimate dehydrogenase|uniref:shikimate kinase n=1 Tax=Holdemanella TaxID=1573535 RepID=UPI00258BD693|nr:shikimate kinase [uncultured Holdemanella sp.]MBD9044712.1 shikimate dehydrogenase [Solobacterium sp.]MBN2950208.1 shikimate dehydrogenase [Holdemanella sp.]
MKYGLIGEHLGHSFSKQIQTRIAEIENVKDYDYQLVELDKEEFKEFMEKKDFKGINVTIPYKKDVIPYLDEMDESAKAIGAVNTIINVDGKLKGYNTDFGGFLYMVKAHNVHMEGKKVLIIGNGGACAAVKAVCKHENAKDIVIVSRSANRGAIGYDEMYTSHLDADIVVNTSPVGMFPNIANAPIDVSWFHKLECVLDVVYNPILTRLCFEAQEADIKRVIGLEMLIAQAKYTFEIFENMSFDDSIIDEIKKEMLKDRCNIVLIGMPSAGKTTIGKMLEEKLGKEFFDLDDMIIAKAGKSIPEIFQESGEAGFRAIETEVAIEASKMNNKIIATGGGVVKHKVNMDFLRLNGITIFIDRDIDKLISSDPNRPLSSSKQALQQMYKERYPLYQKYAAYIAVNNANIEETVDDIVNAYHSILIDAVAE